ncbi:MULTISPECIES: PIN domain-containing protein [unclassified Sphingobium]|uniref:PIN domain-containing protein n=1 Tax=unclassified Sphingobium TaxID=2611147 RepID=UPI0035A7242B
MYLLDTPVLLQLRAARAPAGDRRIASWAARVARDRLFISALSLADLGALSTRIARQDKAAGATMRSWIGQQLVPAFEGHILPVDAAVAIRRGEMPLEDDAPALLAATASEHGLTLVTLDPAAYRRARIRLLDPREGDAAEAQDWRAAALQSRPKGLRGLFIRG